MFKYLSVRRTSNVHLVLSATCMSTNIMKWHSRLIDYFFKKAFSTGYKKSKVGPVSFGLPNFCWKTFFSFIHNALNLHHIREPNNSHMYFWLFHTSWVGQKVGQVFSWFYMLTLTFLSVNKLWRRDKSIPGLTWTLPGALVSPTMKMLLSLKLFFYIPLTTV